MNVKMEEMLGRGMREGARGFLALSEYHFRGTVTYPPTQKLPERCYWDLHRGIIP